MKYKRRKANESTGRNKTEKKRKAKTSHNMKDENSKTPVKLRDPTIEATEGKRSYRRRFTSREEEEAYTLRQNAIKIQATLRMSEWRKGLTEEKKAEINAREAERKREIRKALTEEQKAEINEREAQRKRESRKAYTDEQRALVAKKKAEYRQRKRQEEEEEEEEEERGSFPKARAIKRRIAKKN